jgi:diguanylate cyclase (GGDEF)-like protein
MNQVLSKRSLFIIPILFLFVILLRITYSYYETKSLEYDFAQQEAKALSAYSMQHRDYYQKLFINKTLPLNAKTLVALPAFSSRPISKAFSQDNPFNITIRTVSDRARNPKNSADEDELKAIKYFNTHEDAREYFSEENPQFYHYAKVLKIEQKCLKCHGKKEDAPKFIQNRYEHSYDYKIGELRGILSIKVPTKKIKKYFFVSFLDAVIYDLLLFILLFIVIFYIFKKTKRFNTILELTVKDKTKELQNLLITDDLTSLPNRRKLIEDIEEQEDSSSMHLALLNIDSFKDVNDFYGHEVGDEILKSVAMSITKASTAHKYDVYKLPSDEFAIFTTVQTTNKEFVKIITEIIQTIIKTQINTKENSIFVALSCGIASNEVPIMAKADMALKLSKSDKKDIVIYSKSIDGSTFITQNIEAITLIKDSIANDNFTPFFQPIYNVHTQKIEKYEVLVRIVQNDGTIIPPYMFLEVAMKSKLYPNITQAMISKSFDFFRDKDFEFSINLSINDVLNRRTFDFIIKSLQEFPHPQRVVFEILESDKIGNYEELKDFIKIVKKYGCRIAIDDFGSGYSNFAHIFELNIDYIKIDGSLVKFITTDNDSRVITKTIINFASSLGLKTIAEFVEDKDALEILQKMGIDYIQGYYIGKPQAELNSDWD